VRVRHLYLQIWLAFLGILLAFAVLLAALWWTLPDDHEGPPFADSVSSLVAEALGPAAESPEAVQARLTRIATEFPGRITVLDRNNAVLAHKGDLLPVPEGGHPRRGMHHMRGVGPVFVLRLDDGRQVLVRVDRRPGPRRFLPSLALLLVTTAVGAFFVVRRITRRLERLRGSVEALGGGDLTARVPVEGNDEIARLAESFNDAAARIEQVLTSNRTLLANVSHELRSPLSRIRMALELLDTGSRPELQSRLARDIGELDSLIDELLLSGRVDAQGALREDPVELLALCAELGAGHGAVVRGVEVPVIGDERLLRRLVRNLLENAQRYGAGSAIELEVAMAPTGLATLAVMDRGPGVAPDEQARIFEAFYRPRGMAESGHGVGLGLALVRSIARAHGGEVTYRPRDGGGSVFEVSLPPGKRGGI
jgi:signal transduction histidine kinase